MAEATPRSAGIGQAHRWLAAVCVAVYVSQLLTYARGARGDGWFTEALVLDTARVFQGQVWRLVSYAFLHSPSDWLHLPLNLLFLWLFGTLTEKRLGSEGLWWFSLGAAAFGGLIFCLEALIAGPDRAYGASGVITALMVFGVLQAPYGTLDYGGFLRIPIWVIALLYLGKDLVTVWLEARLQLFTNMALGVHVGGALFALLFFYSRLLIARLAQSPSGQESQA